MAGKGTLTLTRPVAKKIDVTLVDNVAPQTEQDGRFTRRCYVLMGLPATGKSHWVEAILRNWKMQVQPTVICEDMLIEQECARSGDSWAEALARVDAAEQKRMTEELFYAALGVRRDIIIDRHNLTEDDRGDLLLRLPDYYQKIGVVFTCPTNLMYDRLQKRFEDTGRPYSRLVVGNMQRRFERPGSFEFHRVTNIDHQCQYS